ncbi:DNA-binding CsgD family transcriptional regulator [Ilumatobacter fluminis]|uniref:DNA-binding CsgD family transcriptional regulator n=1 Tax=Ilumatobacter fluminis TaxID=467091 RepID=A0A4R7HWI9_9ACTN|nr:helix-turn-helix transcriptional regulator [Ilumatobacter fluminis]TDT14849.1 DNA-binding CsgD family transcriptional regulator [Ilumatobacter fluminis]
MPIRSGRTIERARRALGDHAADSPAWSDFGASVIAVLAELVPFDAAVVSMIDPATGLLTNIVRSGIDDSQDELFMHIELTHPDPITLTTLAGEPLGVGILADHVAGDPYSSPRVRDLLAPHFGLEHEMRGVVRSGGRIVAACGLYRSAGRPGFTADEAIALSALEDAIANGVRRAHGQTGSEHESDTAVGADDRGAHPGPAVMILDADGRVLESTRAAEARAQLMSSAGDGVPHAVRMVAAAGRAQAAGHPVSPVAHVRGVDGRWFVVSAAPLGSDAGQVRTVVTIEPAETGRTLDLDLDLYGVTAREREVVREVVAGASSVAIAGSLGISAHTVQDHLKSVFAKVGVTSRRELVATLTGNRVFSGADRRAV